MEILFLGHAGVLIKENNILFGIDPFITGEFYWEGNMERYRGKSKWIGDGKRFINTFGEELDAIAITHAHGDHFDIPLIMKLLKTNQELKLFLPLPIIEWLKFSSILNPLVTYSIQPLKLNKEYVLKKNDSVLKIKTVHIPGVKVEEYPERLGYFVSDENNINIFFPGDVHEVGDWDTIKDKVSDLILWGVEKREEIINFFSSGNKLKRLWWIHWENFIPGSFLCSLNPNKLVLDLGNTSFQQIIPNNDDWYKLD
jgi:L-ascorbate metabolism protein UlaG (beta-lactamase superfamily)